MKSSYLKTFDLNIEIKTALFIGAGKSYLKKDYVYDPKTKKVRIIDETKMFSLLLQKNLVDAYENFILNDRPRTLRDFFEEYGVSPDELSAVTSYEIAAGDALYEGRAPAEIKAFIKNIRHQAYIPGSSLKGSLRTVLLHKMIAEDPNKRETYLKNQRNPKNIEKNYLNTLGIHQKKEANEVNSILRGVSVSDSSIVSNDRMILVRKDDLSVQGNKNSINIIRECIAPNTVLKAKLTLDTQTCGKINRDFIRESIEDYGKFYNETYLSHFRDEDRRPFAKIESGCIALGGGSGYFSKNLVYVSLGKKEGLQEVSGIMQRKFKRHNHDKDLLIGISPHMIKCGTVGGKLQHYGICKITLTEEEHHD